MELSVPDRDKANRIQEKVSALCHNQIIPKLSTLCDKLSVNQEHIILDKLEIDVGFINEETLEGDLADLLLKKFEEQIKKRLISNSNGSGKISSVNQSKAKEKDTPARTRGDLLVHFFRYGFLPWWNSHLETDIRQLIEDQFEDDVQSFVSKLVRELISSGVRRRVIHYFSDAQFQHFFDTRKMTEIFRLYESVKQLIPSQDNKPTVMWEKMRASFLDKLLSKLGDAGSVATSGTQAFLSTAQKQQMVASAVHILVKEYSISEEILDELIAQESSSPQLFSAKEWEQVYDEIKSPHKSKSEEKGGKQEQQSNTSETFVSKNEDHFIEIQNAGVVLIWSFLEKLFENLGFVEDGTFINDSATHRAVHLLHFISTGQENGEEYEWTLNKLLCGLPPEVFVPEYIELTKQEKSEAEAMMMASIKDWKILKNTSVAGFRETFLLRNGLITSDVHGWKIMIERITYDILLDKLPWPLSVIKLPWNDHIIYVEW